MTQESAFKPYQKFAIEMQVQESSHSSAEESGHEIQVTVSPHSSVKRGADTPQVKPFDYTVEKILKSSPPSVSSTVPSGLVDDPQVHHNPTPSLYDLAKWNNIPLSIIARHLWWQNQKSGTGMADIASREVTSSDFASPSSSMCESEFNDVLCFRYPVRTGGPSNGCEVRVSRFLGPDPEQGEKNRLRNRMFSCLRQLL